MFRFDWLRQLPEKHPGVPKKRLFDIRNYRLTCIRSFSHRSSNWRFHRAFRLDLNMNQSIDASCNHTACVCSAFPFSCCSPGQTLLTFVLCAHMSFHVEHGGDSKLISDEASLADIPDSAVAKGLADVNV